MPLGARWLARWRGALHMLGMAALVVLYSPALAVLPAPARLREGFVRHWTRQNLRWLRLSCGIRARVEGLENLPAGPVVLLVKHQSAWETFALPALLPRRLTFVLKRELLWLPVFGWGLHLIRPVAINRGAPRAALRMLLQRGQARLVQGVSVVIFPEGTRVAPGARHPYQAGGALLAVEAGVPVVPVALDSGRYWPRRGLERYPGVIRLRIGPPIPTAGRRAGEVLVQAEAWMEGPGADLPVVPPATAGTAVAGALSP